MRKVKPGERDEFLWRWDEEKQEYIKVLVSVDPETGKLTVEDDSEAETDE